jgi:hypothetical protein
MMWRFKIFERDWHLWQWRTELAPSGFWIKYRGPFMWWGKGVGDESFRRRPEWSQRNRDDSLV